MIKKHDHGKQIQGITTFIFISMLEHIVEQILENVTTSFFSTSTYSSKTMLYPTLWKILEIG